MTPAIVSLGALGLNIIADVIFMQFFSHWGIALATTVVLLATTDSTLRALPTAVYTPRKEMTDAQRVGNIRAAAMLCSCFANITQLCPGGI